VNIQHSSRSDQWFTPQDIVERARAVLGGIDLDPASCALANRTVRAADYITVEQDGLTLPWHGRVFLNPPGGKTGNKSNTALWWSKLLTEYADCRVQAAVFLAFSLEAMQTTQGCRLSIVDFPFCVPRRRISFVSPDGKTNSPSHGNVIVGVGVSRVLFRDHFVSLGAIRL